MTNEPTLEQIEDYDNKESKEKRKTVKIVILSILVISAVYGFIKFQYNSVNDYIGTPNQPGLSTFKH